MTGDRIDRLIKKQSQTKARESFLVAEIVGAFDQLSVGDLSEVYEVVKKLKIAQITKAWEKRQEEREIAARLRRLQRAKGTKK